MTQQAFRDPVCGMEVTTYTAAAQTNYKGQTYYFCSKADKEAFEREPEKYLKTSKEPTPS